MIIQIAPTHSSVMQLLLSILGTFCGLKLWRKSVGVAWADAMSLQEQKAMRQQCQQLQSPLRYVIGKEEVSHKTEWARAGVAVGLFGASTPRALPLPLSRSLSRAVSLSLSRALSLSLSLSLPPSLSGTLLERMR